VQLGSQASEVRTLVQVSVWKKMDGSFFWYLSPETFFQWMEWVLAGRNEG